MSCSPSSETGLPGKVHAFVLSHRLECAEGHDWFFSRIIDSGPPLATSRRPLYKGLICIRCEGPRWRAVVKGSMLGIGRGRAPDAVSRAQGDLTTSLPDLRPGGGRGTVSGTTGDRRLLSTPLRCLHFTYTKSGHLSKRLIGDIFGGNNSSVYGHKIEN